MRRAAAVGSGFALSAGRRRAPAGVIPPPQLVNSEEGSFILRRDPVIGGGTGGAQ